MRIPLAFPIAYNGLIHTRTKLSQKDALNILINGVNSRSSDAFAEAHVSAYVSGKESLSKKAQKAFCNLSDEEIVARIETLNIDRLEHTVKMFHDFMESSILLDEEKKSILRNLIKEDEYKRYIANAFRLSFDYVGKDMQWITSSIIETLIGLSTVHTGEPVRLNIERFCNLPHRNDYFIGRKEEKLKIEANFRKGFNTQLIYGMGGFGKTQLAIEYAHEHKKEYSAIIFINAESKDSILRQYRIFLSNKHSLPQEINAPSISVAFRNTMECIGGWLIIYDNCDYYDDKAFNAFLKLLPTPPTDGHILITTRTNRHLGKSPRIEVTELSTEEASVFLCDRTGLDDEDGAKYLATKLGNHPLALEMAGAYIQSTPGLTFHSYYENRLQKNIAVLDRQAGTIGYEKTISGIICTTIEQIKADRGNDELSLLMEDILLFCSLMSLDDIDLSLLKYITINPNQLMISDAALYLYRILGDEEKYSLIANVFRDELSKDEFIQTVTRYSLMRVEHDSALSMHPLQQAIIRSLFTKERRETEALRLTAALFAITAPYGYDGDQWDEHLEDDLEDHIGVFWEKAVDNKLRAAILRTAYDTVWAMFSIILDAGYNTSIGEKVCKHWKLATPFEDLCETASDWKRFCEDRQNWEEGRYAEISRDRGWLTMPQEFDEYIDDDIIGIKSAIFLMLRYALVPSVALEPFPLNMEIPSCAYISRFDGPHSIEKETFYFTWEDDDGLFSDADPVGKKYVLRQADGIVLPITVTKYRHEADYLEIRGKGYLSEYLYPIERPVCIFRVDKREQTFRVLIKIKDNEAEEEEIYHFLDVPKWQPLFDCLQSRCEIIDQFIMENFYKIYPDLTPKLDALKNGEVDYCDWETDFLERTKKEFEEYRKEHPFERDNDVDIDPC